MPRPEAFRWGADLPSDPRRGGLSPRWLAVLLTVLAACNSAGPGDSIDTAGPSAGTARTLVAAANLLHPPFSSWGPDGKAVGLEVDIVEAAACELGLPVRWVERPFAELLTAVEDGEVDLAVSTIGITEPRKQRVGFSQPYYHTEIVALVRQDDRAPQSLTDLAHATIGADESTTAYPAARAQWPAATLVGKVRDGMTWPQMVDRKRVDAFVVDASDQERLEAASGVSLRRIDPPLAAESFGVAVALGNDDLRAALDRAIERRVHPGVIGGGRVKAESR